MIANEIGVKVGRVANLGTLLVLCIFLASLSVLTTLVTYIGLSSFWSVDISGLGTVAAEQVVSV
jgi:hypothetical protein